MSQNPRRPSDAFAQREGHQEFGPRGRGLSERIDIPLERRLERPQDFPMEYTSPRRSIHNQHEPRPRGGLDDRIEHDYRPQRIRAPNRRREEFDHYEERPSFESRIAVTDNRTLEERIGYVQPVYKKIPVYDSARNENDGTGRFVAGGKQNKSRAKVQPTKAKTDHFTEFKMQDEVTEGNARDAVSTVSEKVARVIDNVQVDNGSKSTDSNSPPSTNTTEVKLRARLLESMRKKSTDNSQNDYMKENGNPSIGRMQQVALNSPVDYMSALEQTLNGSNSTAVKTEKETEAIRQTLTEMHCSKDQGTILSEAIEEQRQQPSAEEQEEQHKLQQQQKLQENDLHQLLEKRARNDEKQRELLLAVKKFEATPKKGQSSETPLETNHLPSHSDRILKSTETNELKMSDEQLRDRTVLKPLNLGSSNMEKLHPPAGLNRRESGSVHLTPTTPSEVRSQGSVGVFKHVDIQEKGASQKNNDNETLEKHASFSASGEQVKESVEDKHASFRETSPPTVTAPELPSVFQEQIKQSPTKIHQDGETTKSNAAEVVKKDRPTPGESASNFDRKDISQEQPRAGEKHLLYSDAKYREEYRQRVREEEELSRPYLGPRPLHFLPPRTIPEAAYGYHPADYASPYGGRYFPIRAEELQGRRLEVEYDPYYKDLPEWLEMTGYHDLEYRQVSLRRYRELQRECFYPPNSGTYIPVSTGVAMPYEQRLFRGDRLPLLHPSLPIRASPEARAPSPITSRPPPQPDPASATARTQEEKPVYPRHPAEHLRLSPLPAVASLKRRNQYQDEDDTRRRPKTPRLTHDSQRPRYRGSEEYNKERRVGIEPFEQKLAYRRIEHQEDVGPPRPAKRAPPRLSPVHLPREPRSISTSPALRYPENDQKVRQQKRELGPVEAERDRLKHDLESSPYAKRALLERHPTSPETPARPEKNYYKAKMPPIKKGAFRDDISMGNHMSEPDYDRLPARAIRQKQQSFEDSKPKSGYVHGNDGHFEEANFPFNRNFGPKNKFARLHGNSDEMNVSSSPFPVKSDTKYFMIKSFDYQNVMQAQKDNVWATQEKNTEILEEAFYNARDVILLFSVNKSKRFQGYARMESAPGSVNAPEWVERLFWKSSGAFKIQWITKCEIEFYTLAGLKNRYNENEPVFVGRDCQEIDAKCGAELCRVIDERAMFSREYHNQRRE